MNDTTHQNHQNCCPKCQAVIPADAPAGLCPKCVLASAALQQEQLPPSPSEVPSLAQLAAVFPQLELLELIGRGGMGFVFKARQPSLDRVVALKLLPETLAADPHFAERFNREARFLAKLNHPNIVAVHDFGQAGGFYYLVMEYVDGLNLRQAMRAGRFSPGEALAIVPKICEALQYAHEQGVLHRDIKPENLLLDTRGRIKIADFGIAKLIGEEQASVTLTGTGASLGTPHYMAPEQLENPGQVDHRADIYSLGVVFYEMLTGELPIGRFGPPSSRATLDARIDEIVMRALARERELRQKDAREMQTQVETVSSAVAQESARQPENARPPQASPTPASIWLPPAIVAGRRRFAQGAIIALTSAVVTIIGLNILRGPIRQVQYVTEPQLPLVYTSNNLVLPPIDSDALYYPTAEDVSSEKIAAQNDAILLAQEHYEEAKSKHIAGQISDLDLALANRDLAIAEARGDAVAAGNAHYEYAVRKLNFAQNSSNGEDKQKNVWQAEKELNDAIYAVNLAKAGTNPLARASADLSLAQNNFGLANQQKAANAISEVDFKKAQNELLYAELHYKRLKLNESNKK